MINWRVLGGRVFWALAGGVLLIYAAYPAFSFEAMPSTPDISIPDSSTSTINLGRTANFLYLKNDCTQDLYIDLRGRGVSYPLRLKNAESFSAEIQTPTIGVSPGVGASSCTLTVIPAR